MISNTVATAPPALGDDVAPIDLSVNPVASPRTVLELIGNTPLIDLSSLVESPDVHLYAKAEFANPGGSVKDRAALAMVRDAEARGLLQPGGPRRILDSTSGNTGIALAMIGAAMGYGVTLCLPDNASPERKRVLRAYGAEVILTDPLDGSDGAIVEARRMVQEAPERYVYLNQYGNDANWQAHYRTTGPEIWQQTRGQVSHFITGLGTTGTFMGVGRYLKDRNPAIRLISVQPDGPMHGLEGMKHMESALVPPIYDASLADEDWPLATEDAYAMVGRLARTCGLRLGVSAGGNVAASLRLAEQLNSGTVVTILCDNADKYLSDRFWDDL
jgi:S-sulfo-L-cysteine synthase (O-acetyl-L-serine-dependent)